MSEQSITRAAPRAALRPASTLVARLRGHTALALFTILACQLMIVLDATVVNIALPRIQGDLHFSATGLSWVITAYSLTFGGLLLLGGRMGDLLGRRRMLIAGILLFITASLLGGFATSTAWLVVTRAAQGVGAALAAPSALSLLALTFPDGEERARAFGLFSAVSASGASFGLIAGGIIVSAASWRWVLFINVPIGLAVAALALVVVREPETGYHAAGSFDLFGAVSATAGTAALVYGLVHAAADGWRDTITLVAFAASAVLLAAFIAIETRVTEPVVPLRLFRNRDRVVSYVVRLPLVAGLFGMFFFLTQFVQEILGFSPLRTGIAFLPLSLGIFVAARLAPAALARFGTRLVTIGGMVTMTAGMLWLSQISASSGYLTDLLGPMILVGFGAGFPFVTLTLVSLADVAPRDAGAASAMVNVVQQVGGALGLAVLVTIFGSASRHAARTLPAGLSRIDQAHRVLVQAVGGTFTGATVLIAGALVVALLALRSVPSGERA